jgi:hypothetical protein
MSDSTTKRAKVSKPAKKDKTSAATTTPSSAAGSGSGKEPPTGTPLAPTVSSSDKALINIPPIKKKKERHVKTEDDIAAKQERKRLRKEAEQTKRDAKLAKKGIEAQKAAIQNKTPKWKLFLKNTTEADNAEQLKDTSYKVQGDDGSSSDDDDGDTSDSDSDKEAQKSKPKRKTDDSSDARSAKKSKHAGSIDDATLATLDASSPGK